MFLYLFTITRQDILTETDFILFNSMTATKYQNKITKYIEAYRKLLIYDLLNKPSINEQ
jgi:translation initiation factor 2 beta subunit (eIF-2beta)/eIF-5